MADEGKGQESGGEAAPEVFTKAQVDELVAGLKGKNSELLGKLKNVQPRLLPEGLSPEEVQAAIEFKRKAEEDRHKAEGNFTELQRQMAEKHAAELKKIADERDGLLTRAQTREKKAAAVDAIAALGANQTLLLPHVMNSLKVEEVNGEFTVTVVDARGNVLVADGSGTPLTVQKFVEGLSEKPEFAPAFPASGAAGGGARGTSQAGGGTAIVLTEAEARDPARYRAARAEAEKRGLTVQIR